MSINQVRDRNTNNYELIIAKHYLMECFKIAEASCSIVIIVID